MYMLDTNICIYIIKKQPPAVLAKFEQLPIGSVCMSLITFGELDYGALKSNDTQKAQGVLEELEQYIPVLPIEPAAAKHYADIRHDLAIQGAPIGNNDLWIAAHARSLGHTLVSKNLKEFNRVKGLALENWL